MSNNLQIFLSAYLPKTNVPVMGFYLLATIVVIFVVVKLSREDYLKELFSIVSLDKKKFESKSSQYSFSKSSVFLQLSAVILISLGLSIVSNQFLGDYNLKKSLIGVFIFYIFQGVGFSVFSSIISKANVSYLKLRLSYYELLSVFFFPIILIAFYSTYNLSLVVLGVFVIAFVLTMVRLCAYLLNLVSLFHIILYLCTLEIIPILFLLKFIFN